MLSDPCLHYFQTWLRELEAPEPDQLVLQRAARSLTESPECMDRLSFLAGSLSSDVTYDVTCEEAQEALIAISPDSGVQNEALRRHLSICPACITTYAQMEEWTQLTLTRSLETSVPIPHFLVPTQPEPTTQTSPLFWLQDAMGVVTLRFGEFIASLVEPDLSPVFRSGDEAGLPPLEVGPEELPNWEIVVEAILAQEELYDIEVSLYSTGGSSRHEGVPIEVSVGERKESGQTDEGGRFLVQKVRASQLNQLSINLHLPD